MTQTLMGHSPSRLPICLNSPADGRERQLKDSRPKDLPIYYIANIETIKLSQIETVDQGESLSDSKKKKTPHSRGLPTLANMAASFKATSGSKVMSSGG